MSDAGQIVIDPTPPAAQNDVKLIAGPNMQLRIEWIPGGAVEYVTTDASGVAVWNVPATCGAFIVSDPAGSYSPSASTVS